MFIKIGFGKEVRYINVEDIAYMEIGNSAGDGPGGPWDTTVIQIGNTTYALNALETAQLVEYFSKCDESTFPHIRDLTVEE